MPDASAGPHLFVDADACPVKDEVLRVADRHGLAVTLVSNQWMHPATGARVQQVVVSGIVILAQEIRLN